ncbi:MAG: NAD(P)H-dependent oxidoreductase [Blastocatellia bacterium]|nr:NAD(P)H-dependent oxidoreductase [Blastocatellia bacterium]
MSDKEILHLAIIIGSTRQGRFAPTVANWFAGQAGRRDDLKMDVIDLAEARLPDVISQYPTPEVSAITPRLVKADAFVVVTPEYNHSFPAPLKTAIDWHSDVWRTKPVGFVSYGGISGGLRAVEQLRQIFAELHAVTVRDSVSFHRAWSLFDIEGRPRDPDSYERTSSAMLNQLKWWGLALREARTRRPYLSD